jgi:hypothetical protein
MARTVITTKVPAKGRRREYWIVMRHLITSTSKKFFDYEEAAAYGLELAYGVRSDFVLAG